MTIGDLKDLSFSDISDGLLDKHWVSLKLSAHVPCELMGDVRIEHFTRLTKENWEKAVKNSRNWRSRSASRKRAASLAD